MNLYKIPMIEWVDCLVYGPPDDEGDYLCAFVKESGKLGNIETLGYAPGDYRYWKEFTNGERVSHWAELPDHPGRS